MRFRLTAKVEADAKTTSPFSLAIGDLRAGIVADDSGEVTQVWVELPVRDYSPSLPVVTRQPGAPPHLNFREPPEADELLSILQYIESLGAFWLSINRIHWSEANHEWIPETPEETEQLSMFSMTWETNYQRTPIEFQADLFHDLIFRRTTKDWLTIPLSFYREGRNDYTDHRYINAFYNFYFLLEDLFGGGKTKNRQVLESFCASEKLKTAIAHAYRE